MAAFTPMPDLNDLRDLRSPPAPLADQDAQVANRYSSAMKHRLAEVRTLVILINFYNSTERSIDGSETV